LAIARTRRPGIGLPRLNGQEVAREFRSDERLRTVLIIARSAYPPEEVAGRLHERDCDNNLVKHVDLDELPPLIGRPG
jgi:CheY-like chemotaxis protein